MAEMITHTATDEQIEKDVTDELYWDARVNAADVAMQRPTSKGRPY